MSTIIDEIIKKKQCVNEDEQQQSRNRKQIGKQSGD